MATRARQVAKRARSTVRASLKAGVRYDERAKVYVGYAPALNIYSQATTEAHAKRALMSAITLFLNVASHGRGFADILETAGLSRDHRKNGAGHEGVRIHAVEEEILERQNFHCIFDVPTAFRLWGKAA